MLGEGGRRGLSPPDEGEDTDSDVFSLVYLESLMYFVDRLRCRFFEAQDIDVLCIRYIYVIFDTLLRELTR